MGRACVAKTVTMAGYFLRIATHVDEMITRVVAK